ncbi:MAG: Rrf2 family transcriptional regulator [Candidatus Thermoplasmatota archaeon]|nr:Rrf2 family transcriptional regulator [Candidatus Thermoplasmatota archaeon]MBS3790130.1 Rrf2 family transcriptional regulator [Candidatus Thermoplasmatota archaeon]
MVEPTSLTYKQKILLYLSNHQRQDDMQEKQEDITQKGISQNVGISRTHLSRLLSSLSKQDLVKEKMAPVAGHNRKMKTYSLTSQGFEMAESILDELSETSIKIIQGEEEKTMPLTKIKKETDGELDLLTCISLLENKDDHSIDLQEHGVFEPVKMIEEVPELKELYGREEEMQKMKRWIESNKSVLVVLGRKGYGASSLAANFIRGLEERHVLWISLKDTTKKKIEDRLSHFLEKIGKGTEDIIDVLISQKAVVVFDDYYEMGSEIVTFLKKFLDHLEKSDPLKIIVTGREGTPVYERFYRKEHVNKGVVEELNISPLDQDNAQNILREDIKEEALDRIMMFTKGSPLLLKLLREGDKEKLCELTPWGKEQISLLMYLKTETKDR